ncbi:MAG TPA: hypothetical protein VKX25_04075 [Bryobacteraceae bacterium]|jgi:hypothetical protein|nr:hypothetical protein [Bryobacteraceae bacterium]
MPETTELKARRTRLTPASESHDLLPWRRATDFDVCQLYWMPVSSFPMRQKQRMWILRFLDVFAEKLARQELCCEQFLQMKALHPDLLKPFIKTAKEFNPVFGLSRRPGEAMPALPDMAYVKELQEGRRAYDHSEGKPNYCYWFLYRRGREQRELFLGHGGFTAIFVKPDPATKAPEVAIPKRALRNPAMRELIEKSSLQGMLDGAFALKAGFLAQSKELFGADLRDAPEFEGLPYIVPLLDANTVLRQPVDEVARWFTLFDVYLGESPADQGMVLAAKKGRKLPIAETLAALREEGLTYPAY